MEIYHQSNTKKSFDLVFHGIAKHFLYKKIDKTNVIIAQRTNQEAKKKKTPKNP